MPPSSLSGRKLGLVNSLGGLGKGTLSSPSSAVLERSRWASLMGSGAFWAVIEIKMAGCVDARLAVGQFQVQGLALLGEASTSATSITADTLVSSTEPRDWEISFHWTAWKQFPSEPLRQLIMVRLQSFRRGMCQCMLLQKPGAAFRAVDLIK